MHYSLTPTSTHSLSSPKRLSQSSTVLNSHLISLQICVLTPNTHSGFPKLLLNLPKNKYVAKNLGKYLQYETPQREETRCYTTAAFCTAGNFKGILCYRWRHFLFFPCVFNKRLTNISPKSNCSSAAFWEITVVYPMCCAAVLALLS